MVDGNNLLFRSFYATAYNGNFMKNSKGFPTNGLFGFANMINKIIIDEKPTYIVVAFDKGKTFRHEKYDFYKDGRDATPEELKVQFPVAKEMLTAMGIKYYEIDNYEADDIIGTFAKYCDMDDNFDGLIVSSDKDLLQLISKHVEMKLLKSKDYIRYNEKSFKEDWGIDPINIIDLKALMGDPSDNIPGVKGIGEKTALKLLTEYKTLDGVYENIDSIKGATHNKLVDDKENAYMSYEIATICRDVPMDINIPDIKYLGSNSKLADIYNELEFYSLLKNIKNEEHFEHEDINFKVVKDLSEINITEDTAIYLEVDDSNYHKGNLVGMGVYNKNTALFIPSDILKQNPSFLTYVNLYTYDYKKLLVVCKKNNINISNVVFDTAIATYLLEYNIKDDIAYLANQLDYKLPFLMNIKQENLDIAEVCAGRAKFIYETKEQLEKNLKEKEMYNLFKDIELPLSEVLADMEYTGFSVDKQRLIEMGEELKIKIELLTKDIYNYAGCEFNIASTQQLGDVLFEKLGLPHKAKKGKTGYSTAADVLEKLKDKHPIINLILEYRLITKLYTTYVEGLLNFVYEDGKIHTIYTQTLTRTGRLSSIEPNLQNIPIRNEYGRLIRKAFVPSKDSVIVSADYSQIELRIFSCMASVEALINAFKNDIDVHTKTASDIFKVPIEAVTKDMRRVAKAVNFGIIYGISGFGLSENLNIETKEATKFINDYYETYPGIKTYKDEAIKEAHEYGFVKTKYGRIRSIPELDNKNYLIRSSAERIALNTPIQGTAADIIKIAMVNLYNEFKKNNLKSKILVQVHDELVVDCPKDELEIVKKLMKDVMENVTDLEVPLLVDVEYGDDWYQAK